MNKRIRTGLVTAALAGGSLFGVAQVAGTANAQVDDTPADTEQVDAGQVDAGQVDAGQVDAGQVDTPAGDQAEQDGERGPRGRRGHHERRGANVEATAELIGIDADALRTALQDGQTLAEVAEANGVDPQTVIDAKVAQKAERLATAVADGNLTDEEAADKLANATERITTRVNEGRPDRPATAPEG